FSTSIFRYTSPLKVKRAGFEFSRVKLLEKFLNRSLFRLAMLSLIPIISCRSAEDFFFMIPASSFISFLNWGSVTVVISEGLWSRVLAVDITVIVFYYYNNGCVYGYFDASMFAF